MTSAYEEQQPDVRRAGATLAWPLCRCSDRLAEISGFAIWPGPARPAHVRDDVGDGIPGFACAVSVRTRTLLL